MNLRILETFSAMFSSPRIEGFVFIYAVPALMIFAQCEGHYKEAGFINLVWFIVCFFIVRFTLD